jgi:hypothetical protein
MNMAKQNLPVKITMAVGTKELASFKGSNFKDLDEVNDSLNMLNNVIIGCVVSAAALALSKSDKASGSADDIIKASNLILDMLMKTSKEKLEQSISAFTEDTILKMNRGNA